MTVIESREKPVLGVLLGDAAGIGPELVAKIIADGFLDAECRPVIIGDKRVLEMGMKTANVSFPVRAIASVKDARFDEGAQVLDSGDIDPADVVVGKVAAPNGKACVAAIARAAELCKSGEIEGFVFAPLNKTAIKKAGYDYESEHVLFSELFSVTTPFGEINVVEDVMTSRVTSHIPIKNISADLTTENIARAIALITETLRQTGNEKPRIAIATLNPHCGENGTCGREELDVIAPAVAEAIAAGIDVAGPFSADTVFVRAFDWASSTPWSPCTTIRGKSP